MSEIRASQWIPRQTADFIQDPYSSLQQNAQLDPLLVIVCNEFYPVWMLPCLISYFLMYPVAFISSMLYNVPIEL